MIDEAARREVLEETGLVVSSWDGLLYGIEVEAPDMGWHMRCEVHLAVAFAGDLRVDDLEEEVLGALREDLDLRLAGQLGEQEYRLRRMIDTPLAKTRMPYALNPARLARLKGWFLDSPHAVTALPSYAPEVASNPFAAFEQLPVDSRYRFMLDDAQFTIMGFIKGPVCRGQIALNN